MDAAHAEIEAAAKLNTATERDCRMMAIGECVRQGDIKIVRVAAKPESCTKWPHGSKLLVQNDGTQGSRHLIEGDCELWQVANPTPLDGPVVVAHGECRNTHPEHAHNLLAPGVYRVAYQQDHERAELARVRD